MKHLECLDEIALNVAGRQSSQETTPPACVLLYHLLIIICVDQQCVGCFLVKSMSLSCDDLRISQRKQGFLGSGLFVWYLRDCL